GRTPLAVLEHEDHGAGEEGGEEFGRGDQEMAFQGVHGDPAALSRRKGLGLPRSSFGPIARHHARGEGSTLSRNPATSPDPAFGEKTATTRPRSPKRETRLPMPPHTSPYSKARVLLAVWSAVLLLACGPARAEEPAAQHRLYVAVPGIRDYLEYGGHGLLVYEMDRGHELVKRIKTAGLDPRGKPLNVKGICASADSKRLYISTTKQLMCLDLLTEQV